MKKREERLSILERLSKMTGEQRARYLTYLMRKGLKAKQAEYQAAQQAK